MLTVFGAHCGKSRVVKKAFWKCIRKSHQRPAVQHNKFVLLDTEKNRGPYYPIPLVFHGEQNSIFTL